MIAFLEAESGVRNLLSRYADAVWRKDLDAFADCFAEACEWRIAGRVFPGRSAITAQFGSVATRFRRILFKFQPSIVAVGENGTASARTAITEYNILADGRPFHAIGTYYDHVVSNGERWCFTWRLFQTHYAGPPDMSGEFITQADYGAPPAMPPRDAIPNGSTGFASAPAAQG